MICLLVDYMLLCFDVDCRCLSVCRSCLRRCVCRHLGLKCMLLLLCGLIVVALLSILMCPRELCSCSRGRCLRLSSFCLSDLLERVNICLICDRLELLFCCLLMGRRLSEFRLFRRLRFGFSLLRFHII